MNFEIELLNKLREYITPGSFFDKVFEFITFFGEQYILIVAIILVYFIYSKKIGQKIAFTIFTSLLINNCLKTIVRRPRPFENPNHTFQPSRPETATGYSFPSGHTQNAAVTYTSIAILVKKRRVTIILAILITLIALSRMFLGVHYLTDVIVGAGLGVGISFLGFFLHQKVEDNFKKQLILYVSVALIFLPFLFLFWKDVLENYRKFRDFYISYSFYLGYITSFVLEHKLVDFDCSQPLKIKIIRAFLAMFIALITLFGLDMILPVDNVLFDMLRYFLTAVVTLALYPFVFKNLLFKKS